MPEHKLMQSLIKRIVHTKIKTLYHITPKCDSLSFAKKRVNEEYPVHCFTHAIRMNGALNDQAYKRTQNHNKYIIKAVQNIQRHIYNGIVNLMIQFTKS